jgi:hypothetical protein
MKKLRLFLKYLGDLPAILECVESNYAIEKNRGFEVGWGPSRSSGHGRTVREALDDFKARQAL